MHGFCRMKYGNLIDYNLIDAKSAPDLFSTFLHKNQIREFGILESPLSNSVLFDGEVTHKIFICGKSGSGKTSIVSKLSDQQNLNHETLGLQTQTVYWPVFVKETSKTVLFKLNIWDCSEYYLNTYSHILPSCFEQVDCILYTFSLSSKSMFDDLPKLIARINAEENIMKIFVGSRLQSEMEVTSSMIKDLEQVWKTPVLKFNVSNSHDKHLRGIDLFKEIAPFLNRLCELLWYNDQVKASVFPQSAIDYCFVDDTNESDMENKMKKLSNSYSSRVGKTKVTYC